MRPSLTLVTATLAFAAASVVNASPVAPVGAAGAIAERAPAVDAAAAVDVPALEARARKHHKKAKKHAHHKKGNSAKATFYTGSQLNAPACGDPTPGDNDMIAAVKQGSSHWKCHDRITLHRGGKSVTVKVVDMCAGCEDNHIDLTKGAFKKLGKLSEGVLDDLTWSM